MQYSTTSPERSGIVMLKLKRKLQFRSHAYFQAVRPQIILCALNWLKINNPLYNNIAVDMSNIQSNLLSLQQDCSNQNNKGLSDENEAVNSKTSTTEINSTVSISQEQNCADNDATDDNEEKDNPLNEFRTPTNEICPQSVIPDYPVILEENDEASLGNEIYSVPPGEKRHLTDRQTM